MQDLASRLSKGDESAYAEFYDATADKIFHYLRRRLGEHEAACEVLQETFLRVVRYQRRLKKVDNLEAYVFQIARNEANRRLRRKKVTVSLDSEVLAGKEDSKTVEAAEEIELALRGLDDLSRDIIQLKIYGDLTFKSIAETLGLPLGTVATRYRRALDRLRGTLDGELQ